ncbi:biotin--[acetyl-CoA-carboxylase] ligase [Cytobacillus gottheilii]|uniref:Bifunctional ligase/repressor BirA n=1 Tax=Cytobacillus gottheilii TaxID=859144 RepID=A0ABX8F9K0_9BACI|nr:biotin--[acetyl-CoA-carboxylase] ligase [Cytobacillus gottheilii]QVY60146.1 biotin--[acetyl-CoA-carboxylase] ligase [Cytobacillus gottheilii]
MQSELRMKMLDAFTKSGDEFVSGQHLADVLNCSRTAVWKHIEELRKEGFILEAVKRKGYRIIKAPEHIGVDEIRFGLQTDKLGKNIHYEESVGSTQKIASRLVLEGAPEGTIVIAEEQVAGRGRMDRSWHSPKYTGIWMSVILRPNIPPQKAPQLTLITAVAVVQAMEEAGLHPAIKWPNDILLNGKKATGILTELQADADRIQAVIIGIGINVNQKHEDYPEELQSIATSMSIEAGKPLDRAQILQHVLYHLEKLYLLYLDKGFQPIKLLWESYAITIGKKITARSISETIHGKALGITEDGVLLIEDESGKQHHIYSADIEL